MKPLLNLTIAQFMERAANRWPDRPALSFQGRCWTYWEMEQLTDRIAAGLMAAGVRRGDHVAILSENIPNAVFCFLAVEKAGCVSCMLNTGLKAGELAELMALSDVRYLMIGNNYKDVDFYEESRRIVEIYPLEAVFDIGGGNSRPCLTLEQLIQKGMEQPQGLRQAREETRPQDDGLILYTSGTTGSSPKAVVSSYYNLVNGGIQKAHSQSLTEWDVICCALQLFHIFCIDVNVLSALACGACLAMPDDLHTRSILDTIQAERCTVLSCVPCMYQAMMGRGDFGRFDVSSLRTGIIGGAYCPPETFVRIEETFGLTLLPGLGQTEATAGIAIAAPTDSLEIRSTTVGRFVDHSDGKIADLESGTALKTGETGEICVKSSLLMTGYYNRPDLTAQAIDRDGWLHTGDLGFLDSGGYLHYVGRIKELINRGGEKIIPAEVEAAVSHYPGVKECKVIGLPDPYYGEEVCACLVPARTGEPPDAEQIRAYLEPRLARFKLPRHIVTLPELPMNSSGKVRRGELRRLAAEALGLKS
ncbi:AMP-binding protein [Enterocloster sp.]|uniref:class I adenylate-forming enzyme family protein n=1 Tax=Enterocloster sp. TaxID=2719315 RepID=UPI00283B9074|nr:AMP-binding protein [Enterocloster sp.]MDR3755364.1 AMP-binding protein [Enterocloster sp.]